MTFDANVPRKMTGRLAGIGDRVALVDVEVVDGRPHFVRIEFPEPCDARLLGPEWERAGWEVIIAQVVEDEPDGSASDDEILRHARRVVRVDRAAEASRKYNRMTHAQLLEVLELADGPGGVQAVADRFVVGRRQADRYIARARKELGK